MIRRVSTYLSLCFIALATLAAWHGPIPLTLGCHDAYEHRVREQNRQRELRAERERDWDTLSTLAAVGCAAGVGIGLLSLGVALANRRSKREEWEQRRREYYGA